MILQRRTEVCIFRLQAASDETRCGCSGEHVGFVSPLPPHTTRGLAEQPMASTQAGAPPQVQPMSAKPDAVWYAARPMPSSALSSHTQRKKTIYRLGKRHTFPFWQIITSVLDALDGQSSR